MGADESTQGTGDCRRVSLDEAYEIEYWTHALGASEEDIRLAIAQVGSAVADVRRALGAK
jgi:NACalpha-BTF3-like transcription factor